MKISKSNMRTLLLSAMVFFASRNLLAMEISTTDSKKNSWSKELNTYSNCFFKSWGPTLVALGGLTTYWARYDHQAPSKALTWAKDTFHETPAVVKYPLAFLGGCMMWSYYNPKVKASWNYLKPKLGLS